MSNQTDNQGLLGTASGVLRSDEGHPGFGRQQTMPLPDDAVIILPIRGMLLFPGTVGPIAVGRERSVLAVQEALRLGRPVGLLLQKDPSVEQPGPEDLHRVGTIVSLLRNVAGPDGTQHVACQGEQRFRIVSYLEGYPFLAARVLRIPEPEAKSPATEARYQALRHKALEGLAMLPNVPAELNQAIQRVSSAAQLADMLASILDVTPAEKQELLEAIDLDERLDKVSRLVGRRLEVLKLQAEIAKQTKETLDERQREFFLREQLNTIQKQLGDDGDKSAELEDLEKAIDEAGMPEEVEKQARKELKRLRRMSENAAEYSMVRTYLDWLVELPWKLPEPAPIDIAEARRILDEDHFGLDKVKRRIVEYLAVRKLAPNGKAPILALVGPPGVGKTSLGQSIARAMGRKFVRVSLGGVHDEAEIRGHRRTYVGALPGNIIQAIRKAGTRDAVVMLDELDKVGTGIHGDPNSALLEVLDPEQNGTFRDNYLGVPYDLSRIVFIGTANMLDGIPGPLRDRLEIIQLAGYTEQEKLQIARRYLVRRQLEANGLTAEQATIDDAAIRAVIGDYTREAGVRTLERSLGSVFRNVAVRIAEGTAETVEIGPEDLAPILGPARFENEAAMRTSVPGVATGLAWTPVGGDILFIEANRVPGSGRQILTGQLGDVMKESAQAALSVVKNRAAWLGVAEDVFEKHDIHVHVPAGAIPKDGPSAGVAMFMAQASLVTGRTVRSDTAMTGEISLRGLVLPVGGIKEKVLAAARAGITRVMLPARNRKDLEDIPEDIRQTLEFIWLEKVEDAVAAALEPAAPAAEVPAAA